MSRARGARSERGEGDPGAGGGEVGGRGHAAVLRGVTLPAVQTGRKGTVRTRPYEGRERAGGALALSAALF